MKLSVICLTGFSCLALLAYSVAKADTQLAAEVSRFSDIPRLPSSMADSISDSNVVAGRIPGQSTGFISSPEGTTIIRSP